jgi:CheY-like chemotaxis protein
MSGVMLIGKESALQHHAIGVAKSALPDTKVTDIQQGKIALAYLESAFKGNPDYPLPFVILLDMQIDDMSGIEFLMNYSNFPLLKRERTNLYIYTASKASYIQTLPRIYECVSGVLPPPVAPDFFEAIVPKKVEKNTWFAWLKGFSGFHRRT